jgi:hypothetical protein
MNFKYIIPILLITMIYDRIEAKCISNVTTTNIYTTTYTESLTQIETETPNEFSTFSANYSPFTTPTPIPIICTNSNFQILPYTFLNSQAFQDFNIAIITTIKIAPVRLSVTCACARACARI